MKKLSFLIPSYKAMKWFNMNIDMWKELGSIVEIIIVEDSLDGECEEFAKKYNFTYYKKANGNWGSVINFAKKNKIIKTEYMAIVDSDDAINISELKKLIQNLGDKDIYYTNFLIKSFNTGKEKIKNMSRVGKGVKPYPFIHSVWFRTSIFYNLPDLPENSFFTDGLVDTFLLSNCENSMRYLNFTPYIYHVNLPGQSAGLKKTGEYTKNVYFILEYNKFIGKQSKGLRASASRRMVIRRYKKLYGHTNLKETREKVLTEMRKTSKTHFEYFRNLIILKLHRFFISKRRKGLSTLY